jgi:subtilisin-like proprotein convertase family protein
MTTNPTKSALNLRLHASARAQRAAPEGLPLKLGVWCLKFLWSLVFGVWCFSAPAALYTYSVNQPIPDNSSIGLTDSHSISGLGFQITDVRVSLNISGGYNGDLYGYLRLNDSPLVVLLNQVGVTSLDPDGYGNSGFSVTLSAGAAHDIHFYQNFSPSYNGSGQLTGTWQADGRANPLDTSRSSLADFNGFNPNGTWTLFFADQSPGDESTLLSWSLDISAIPERADIALLIFATLAALLKFLPPLLKSLRRASPTQW